MKTEKKKEETAETVDFLSMTDFEMRLAYAFAQVEIIFPVGIQMSDDLIAIRQKFYKLPDADQAERLYKYHVEIIGGLLTAKPTGLPGFDELFNGSLSDGSLSTKLRNAFGLFFEEETPMKRKILVDALNLYNRMTSPVEFFR